MCAYTFVAANGPRFFTVERPDGSTSWYGDRRTQTSAADGGVADGYLTGNASGQTEAIYLWAQTRFQDSTGNYIDYLYLKDPGGVGRPGEQVLSEVQYTGKVVLPGQGGTASAPYAKLAFDYVAKPTAEFAKTHAFGSTFWQTRELASITAFNDGVSVRHYPLTYATSGSGSGVRRLTAVKECRDSTQSVCLPPTTFTWSTAVNSFATLENVTSPGFEGLVDLRVGDIDGDGRLDLAWFKNVDVPGCQSSQLFVSFGALNASGQLDFDRVAQTPYCIPRKTARIAHAWHLLDYDGDGKDDLFVTGGVSRPHCPHAIPLLAEPVFGGIGIVWQVTGCSVWHVVAARPLSGWRFLAPNPPLRGRGRSLPADSARGPRRMEGTWPIPVMAGRTTR